jgi:uncharacterized protein YhaN
MFYKNIYIRDFGIFNNQNLNDISKNLVVIGGKNRAGKSTFLKLLRHLPYGLPQNDSIPPARNQYYIETEIERGNKDYKLFLNGYAAPEVIDQDENKIDSAELFNHLDQLSYQQLFTISLNELQKLSKIADGKKKEKRLYSVLMGAGLSELVKVPELADKYFNSAKNIGGVLGDPSVASFKPYYNEIKEAEEIRDQALLEIKEFNKKREELKKTEEKSKKLKINIGQLEDEIFILDLLKNNYSTLNKIENLKLKLGQSTVKNNNISFINLDKISDYKQKLDLKKDELQTFKNELNKSIKRDTLADFLNFIRTKNIEINNYHQKVDLLNEKIKNFSTQNNKIKTEYQDLILECNNLNSNWENPLTNLDEINLDLLNQETLNNNLRKNDELKSKIKSIKAEIDRLELEIEEAETELTDINYKKPASILKKTYSILVLSMIILTSSIFINYSQIKYFSLVIALTAFIYYNSNYKSSKLEKEKADKLKNNLIQKENNLNSLKKKLSEKRNSLKLTEKKLTNIAQSLKIKNTDEHQSFNYLKSYFLEIKDKKRRYNKLKTDEKENDKLKEEIIIDLENIYNLIKKADEYCNQKFNIKTIKIEQTDQLINQAEYLFKDLELLTKLKKMAADFSDKQQELNNLINDIESFLNDFKKRESLEIRLDAYYKMAEQSAEYKKIKEEYQNKKSQLEYTLKASDKIKETLNKLAGAANYYQSFLKVYRDFSSLSAVEEEKINLTEDLNSSQKQKDRVEERITTLKNEIKILSSSTKIENAQAKINQAQNNLEKKAQRYAVNKSVYFILKKLRARMVEKAETELLKPASDILAKISDKYYKKLETADDLESSEFKTITADGKEFNSVNQLSRGSLEQLFLAVRISRIKEIKPKLPIVLDDSLVNFDSNHLYNTAKIIVNLAKQHQIFVLSCHPHLVKYIGEITKSAQYWKLESGQFELSQQQKLVDYLKY